ncbi:MAG: NTP transferase domain-containing protein, partial [Thermodesulfobacteriota bacterium]
MPLRTIILAAGKGTRMKSDLPKVIHPILNKPMLGYVLDSVKFVKPDKTYIIVGYERELIYSSVNNVGSGTEYVIQNKQFGTGH